MQPLASATISDKTQESLMSTPIRSSQKPLRVAGINLAAIVFFFSLLASVSVLAGCSNEPIFAAIEKEIKLKDPTMRGYVDSLAVVDGNIYATNGRIYKRTGGSGGWEKIDSPDFRCGGLATDGINLYGLFQDKSYATTSVQMLSGGSWGSVSGGNSMQKISSGNGRIFGFAKNSGAETYTAYTTAGAGSTLFSVIAGAPTTLTTPIGAITIGGTDYFATASAVYTAAGVALTGTGIPTTGIKGITSNGTDIYVVTTGFVYRCATPAGTPTWTSVAQTMSSPTGITFFKTGTTELLLICGAKGYGEIPLASGAMGTYQTPGSAALSSIITTAKSQYDSSIGLLNLTSIFVVPSPAAPSGNTYALYASIADVRYDGLWGYYSDTQTEWNRE